MILRTIIDVKPLEDCKLLLTFDNNVKKIKDMKPYLNKGVFKILQDKSIFYRVNIVLGTISWGDIDMCPDSLYESSKEIDTKKMSQSAHFFSINPYYFFLYSKYFFKNLPV